jgi:hypothetical protein
MMDDVRPPLQKAIGYCDERWVEADQASAEWPPPEVQTSRKMAYDDVALRPHVAKRTGGR